MKISADLADVLDVVFFAARTYCNGIMFITHMPTFYFLFPIAFFWESFLKNKISWELQTGGLSATPLINVFQWSLSVFNFQHVSFLFLRLPNMEIGKNAIGSSKQDWIVERNSTFPKIID